MIPRRLGIRGSSLDVCSRFASSSPQKTVDFQ
jgi:hypothetical protein